MNNEICICAAIVTDDGCIVRGHRHADCIRTALDMQKNLSWNANSQGFITSRNRFVTRAEGKALQIAAGILSASLHGYRGEWLYSEDLY